MRTVILWVAVLAASILGLLVHVVAPALVQSGTCYTQYGIQITSCNDLNGRCNRLTCNNNNGIISYTCATASYYCSGSVSPATPAPTPSTALSGDCIAGRGLALTTCADTSSFNTIGCTCYKCNEVNGHITLSCSSPFVCSNTFEPQGSAEAEPPKLKLEDYVIVIAVFAGPAALVALIAWLTKPRLAQDSETPTMSMLNPLYYLKMLIQKLREFIIEPNVRDDGSLTTLCEFWASTSPWIALVSCGGPRNAPQQYKRPLTKVRAIFILIGEVCITLSLSFLLGTVANNSQACSSTINHDRCQQGGSLTDSRVDSSQSNGQCDEVDIGTTTSAYIISTILSQVVGGAGSYAEGTARGNAKRMTKVDLVRVLLTVGLLVFGFVYSYLLVSKSSGADVATRRYKTIIAVLWPSWLSDQGLSTLKLLGQRCCIVLVRIMPKDLRVSKPDQPAASVVRPASNVQLQPPEAPHKEMRGVDASNVDLKLDNLSELKVADVDAMVRDTEVAPIGKGGFRQ